MTLPVVSFWIMEDAAAKNEFGYYPSFYLYFIYVTSDQDVIALLKRSRFTFLKKITTSINVVFAQPTHWSKISLYLIPMNILDSWEALHMRWITGAVFIRRRRHAIFSATVVYF
ncbi:hypothetical protein ACJX0J_039765 [Zea mays]